jgi:hypothetical protein
MTPMSADRDKELTKRSPIFSPGVMPDVRRSDLPSWRSTRTLPPASGSSWTTTSGAEANARTPRSATPALAGAYSQRLAGCRTQAEYKALCDEIKSAVAARRLTNGDRETLVAVAREAAARFPEVPTANGASHAV